MSAYRRSLLGTSVVLAALAVAAPAQATSPVPFTITEDVLARTFTATGPLCPSGTFEDDQAVFAGRPEMTGQANVVIHTVYTCDDGSGTFDALKVQHITFAPSGLGLSGTGRITLNGGTGAYTTLQGFGTDNGFINFDTGDSAGNIGGQIVRQ